MGNEPKHGKTFKIALHPAKIQISLHSLIRVFAVSWKKLCVHGYLQSVQQRAWSDCREVQANPSLHLVHIILYVLLATAQLCCLPDIELKFNICHTEFKWAPSSEFVSSSIPSWPISTAHAQPFRGARDLAFCLKVSLDSLLVWASSKGSGETARMRRLAWTFAARIGDKYQICLSRPKY